MCAETSYGRSRDNAKRLPVGAKPGPVQRTAGQARATRTVALAANCKAVAHKLRSCDHTRIQPRSRRTSSVVSILTMVLFVVACRQGIVIGEWLFSRSASRCDPLADGPGGEAGDVRLGLGRRRPSGMTDLHLFASTWTKGLYAKCMRQASKLLGPTPGEPGGSRGGLEDPACGGYNTQR